MLINVELHHIKWVHSSEIHRQVFHGRKGSDRVWTDMRVSKWWQNFNFGCCFKPHAESHTPPVHGKARAWSAWHAPVGVASFSMSRLQPLTKTSRLPLAWRHFDPRLVSWRIYWQLLSSALSLLSGSNSGGVSSDKVRDKENGALAVRIYLFTPTPLCR